MADIASPLNPLGNFPVATSAQIARPDGSPIEATLALPANNANGNLYESGIEYLNVGDVQAWGAAGGMTVVLSAGAKRMVTPAAGAAIALIDPASRTLPISAFPNGRVSASVIIGEKPETTAAAIRVRLYAVDVNGATVNWPDTSASDEPFIPGYYTRNVPTAAITGPTELVVAQNVAVPPTAARIGWFFRLENAPAMVWGDGTIRNGADPHYVAPRLSPRSLADALGNSTSALAMAISLATSVALVGSANSNPNVYGPDPELDTYALGDAVAWKGANLLVVANGAAKMMRTPSVSAPLGVIDADVRRIPVSNFPDGIFSASIAIGRKDATVALTDIRVRLYAYDAAGAQMNWPFNPAMDESGGNFVGRYMPLAAISKRTEIVIAKSLAIPAGAATIGWGLRADTATTMDFGFICHRNGDDPHYLPPRVTPKQVSDALATAGAAVALVPKEDQANYNAVLPNRFTAAEVDVQAMRYASGNSNSLTATTFGADKRPVWSFSRAAGLTEVGSYFGAIPRADLDNGSGVFSVALQVYSQDAYVGPSGGQNIRFLVVQRNSQNVEVTPARVVLTPAGVGVSAITAPTWFRQSGIALSPDAAMVYIYVGIANANGTTDRTVKFGDMMLAPGSSATFRRPPAVAAATNGGGGLMVVSPTGSDSAAGTLLAPMATWQLALNKMGGSGTIIALNGGAYTAAQARIAPSTVTGKLTILGQRGGQPTGYDSYPIVYCASKLTGIAKTSGRAKVHQVALTGAPTNANFNWAYQDGVADPRTVIAPADRAPQHRGRANRLHWATKLVKTTATVLANALDEIDAADEPSSTTARGRCISPS
jgi:hypothetical protein